MVFEDIKNLSSIEIHKKIRDTKEKMFEAKMKNAMGQLTNPTSIRVFRKDIAKLRTALTANMKAN